MTFKIKISLLNNYELFFLIFIVGGGVQTASTPHVGHFNLGLLYLPRVIVRMENLVE
jgi:hypothetical protein